MVAAEEERIKERETAVKARESQDEKNNGKHAKHTDLEHNKNKADVRAP